MKKYYYQTRPKMNFENYEKNTLSLHENNFVNKALRAQIKFINLNLNLNKRTKVQYKSI